MKTVIVMPAYNEGRYITNVIAACQAEGFQDIVVVDDGSNDNTAAVARNAGARVVSHIINRGVGAATQTGLETAKKLNPDVVVTIDADGQHSPSDIPRVVAAHVEHKNDITIGSRFLTKNNTVPLSRRFYNKIANLVSFLLSGRVVSDSQSGFKVFSRKALDKICLTSNGYEFSIELIRIAGNFKLAVGEVPVSVVYTPYSLSKGQHLAAGFKTVFKLILQSLMR